MVNPMPEWEIKGLAITEQRLVNRRMPHDAYLVRRALDNLDPKWREKYLGR